jgi:hypothetical protein
MAALAVHDDDEVVGEPDQLPRAEALSPAPDPLMYRAHVLVPLLVEVVIQG